MIYHRRNSLTKELKKYPLYQYNPTYLKLNEDSFMPKTLVVYHYYEKDSTYRDNFLHFFTFGYSEEVDYVVVVAGSHTLSLPAAGNISYVFTENLNNDFGGYCFAINNIINVIRYEFFFFINSSVRGPFLTARDKRLWTEYFIDQIRPDVGIVGSTINILPKNTPCAISYASKYGGTENLSHVQSTSYLLPKKTLLYLIADGFFSSAGIPDKEEAIRDYEVRLSQLIKEQGWNLKSLLPEYNAIDYRTSHDDINPTSDYGDPCFKDSYFGRTVHPHEIIFVKINRNIYSPAYLDNLAFSLLSLDQSSEKILGSKDLSLYQSRIHLVKHSKERLSIIPLAQAYKALIKRTIRKIKGRDR